jgi:hypothetical protein
VLVIDLVLGVLAGFMASLTRPELRRWFHGDWFVPVCYVMGTLLLLPFSVGAFISLGGQRDQCRLIVASHLLSAGAVGAGVMGARTIAPDR